MLVDNLDLGLTWRRKCIHDSFKQLLSVYYTVVTMWALERQNLLASETYGPIGKQTFKWDVQETWLWHVKKFLWYNMIHAWIEMNLMHRYISLEEVYRITETFTQEWAWSNKWMVSTIQLHFFLKKRGRKRGREEGREGRRTEGEKERRKRDSINCSVGEIFLIMCTIHLSAFITFAL